MTMAIMQKKSSINKEKAYILKEIEVNDKLMFLQIIPSISKSHNIFWKYYGLKLHKIRYLIQNILLNISLKQQQGLWKNNAYVYCLSSGTGTNLEGEEKKRLAFLVETVNFPKYNISKAAVKTRGYTVNRLNLRGFFLHNNTISSSICLVLVKKTKFFEEPSHHNEA